VLPPADAEAALMEGMMESLAEYYSKQLSTNITRGMRFNAEHCYYNGHKTLGYKPEEGKKRNKAILVDPDTAPVVQRIFADYESGKPLTVIMNELNNQGLRSVRGDKFTVNSLRNILHNEMYTGVYKYGEIVIEDGVPALITKARFANV
jgi:DNA invertase Pin-like site-specific DNA recombinase